jgi:hypothetical protein
MSLLRKELTAKCLLCKLPVQKGYFVNAMFCERFISAAMRTSGAIRTPKSIVRRSDYN